MGKYAVIIVSTLLLSLSAFSYVLVQSYRASDIRTTETYSYHQANNIAQAVLAIAVRELQSDSESDFIPGSDSQISYPSGGGFEDWPDMDGSFRLLFENSGDSVISVEATGRFNDIRYTSRVGLLFNDRNLFEWPQLHHAVFSDGNITLLPSAKINGDVATNSTNSNGVTFDWGAVIDGNLSVGAGSDPDSILIIAPPVSQHLHYDDVTGQRNRLPREMTHEMPPFPSMPNSVLTGRSLRVTTEAEQHTRSTFECSFFHGHRVEEVAVGENRSMTLNIGNQDCVLHTRDLNMTQGNLNVVGDGTLTIYVENQFLLEGSSTLNQSGDSDKVMIYYAGSSEIGFGGDIQMNSNLFVKDADISVGGSNQLRGNIISGGDKITFSGSAGTVSRAIFAPNADFVLEGSGYVRGAVVAKTFTASGESTVDFDDEFEADLPDIINEEEDDSQPLFTFTHWY
ncbi:hypothetical protein QA596_09430 [Balneolales bacterium ANBcel1]|nr:hypothetical protein [Balneolales bacterium ANBcel1]